MRIFCYPLCLAMVAIMAPACGPAGHGRTYALQYAFHEQKAQQVEAYYVFQHHLQKKHQGRVFADKKQGMNVRATFQLQVQQASPDRLLAQYILLYISIHDQAGNFRLELGPENGRIYWYGQEESLGDYLGEEGLLSYRVLMAKPLAVVVTDSYGTQKPAGAKEGALTPGFNQALVALLGQNRIWGQIIVKSMKIPPVLMVIFPPAPVAPGQKWTYQAANQQQLPEEDAPVSTVFQLRRVRDERLTISCMSRLDFSGEELTSLGKRLGMPEFEEVSFQTGFFELSGEVDFNAAGGRPEKGKLQVRKKYGLKTEDEVWELEETENYSFIMPSGPDPAK